MIELMIAIVVSVVAATLIVKKYQPHTVLLLAGLTLFAVTAIFYPTHDIVFKKDDPTGWAGFDIFEHIHAIMSYRLAGLGLIIMAAGGFAKYMDHIGATQAMVNITTRPLARIGAPYVVLAIGYAVGQVLNIFIPSAAGLAMLLLVTLYPTLVKLGVSRAAAAAMIGTTSVLDLGPASGTANLAAHTANIDVAIFFAQYQIPVAACIIPVICILTYVSAKYFDRRDNHEVVVPHHGEVMAGMAPVGDDAPHAPGFYALLPILPLTLILIFSKLLIHQIELGVVTAMIIGALIGLFCEMFRNRHKMADVLNGFMVFFRGMGNMFSTIISLIICAEFFAAGLKAIGAIDFMIASAQNAGFGILGMMLIACALVAITAIMTGSGNAAFFSFASLAPNITAGTATGAVSLLLPLQFTAGIARSLSPVSGVIIAVAEVAECSPIDIVKRTAIPLIGGLVMLFVYNLLFVVG
ncbi:C4-dicarboxylate transporter DcuC [uncultured Thalassospira sp.]|jgi:DcuC family C4-dicarboxylate transporter|uniref:C4-dicarboxylate transporter DcuC n=1 Tax=uncultured Thalassospira sp. TaxID=404382 RepID=UPI0030D8E2D8|tara:strand:- start:11770 stop:13167 length:1398 start_codon:yes stop_codon:yes gene_type:complete